MSNKYKISHDSYPIKLKVEELKTTLPLPNILTLRPKSGKDKEEPYIKFYEYIAKELGVELKDINVSNVFLTEKTYKILSEMSLEWLKKSISYWDILSDKRKAGAFAMYSLNYSPVAGKGLVLDDKLIYIRKEK